MRLTRPVTAGLAAAAAAGTLFALPAGAAQASTVRPQAVHSVCADDLYVRVKPAGVSIGTLYKGDNFDLSRYSPSGDWAYGHAYGDVHQDGWVQSSGLC